LIVTLKGTILAFCEAREGDDGSPTDLVLKRSLFTQPVKPRRLNGYERTFGYAITWEPMRVVLAGNGEAIMNPCPVIDRTNGTIWMPCFKVSGGTERHIKDELNGRVLMLKSTDDGVSWSPPEDITSAVDHFIAGSGVGIQLREGRLVIPGYGRNPRSGKSSSRVIYSDDHGKTWHAGACVTGNTDEAQIVELSDGTLMMNMRGAQKKWRRHVALSRDRGQTWYKEYEDENLPEPQCQASLLGYASKVGSQPKNLLLFSNPPNPGPSDGRNNLTVRLSYDGLKN
jgi:sialidase-1